MQGLVRGECLIVLFRFAAGHDADFGDSSELEAGGFLVLASSECDISAMIDDDDAYKSTRY